MRCVCKEWGAGVWWPGLAGTVQGASRLAGAGGQLVGRCSHGISGQMTSKTSSAACCCTLAAGFFLTPPDCRPTAARQPLSTDCHPAAGQEGHEGTLPQALLA